MIQTRIITDLIIEPVILDEVKAFMEIDFDDFDALLTRLIKQARISSEIYTGLSYGKKEIELVSNQSRVQIPNGPFAELLSIVNYKDNVAISADNYHLFGLDRPVLTVGLPELPLNYDPYFDILGSALRTFNEWKITYNAGYYDAESEESTLPEDLKSAICMRVETAFKYRADATDENVNKAITTSTDIENAYRVTPIM
jgi:uncharacterized phiE125 gp8 family phage protein